MKELALSIIVMVGHAAICCAIPLNAIRGEIDERASLIRVKMEEWYQVAPKDLALNLGVRAYVARTLKALEKEKKTIPMHFLPLKKQQCLLAIIETVKQESLALKGLTYRLEAKWAQQNPKKIEKGYFVCR